MVKRLLAVGTGATMLGATAMGAMAADLGSYPDMFVTDGTFNGFLVVGEAAAPIDNLAMTDIAASMQYTGSGATTTTTVEGDTWLVGTSSKYLEIANSNATASAISGETFRDISTFIGDEELAALGDGTWSTNEADHDFQQFLFFDDTGDPTVNRIVKYVENDADITADHLFIKSGRQIARYKLEFSSSAQSDVTDSGGTADSTGTYLDDFENTDLSIMGSPYTVVLARRVSQGGDANQHGMKLTLMGGATTDTMLEGETKTYTVSGSEYEVTLSFVDSDEGKFTVNGESSSKLKVGETYILSDDTEIGVSEVLYQDYAGGVHSVTFFLGASKVVLEDQDNDDTGTGEKKMKVGSEDIDGTLVFITGTDDNTTATINTIEINMTADDDYFVGSGGKLSEAIDAEGDEEEILMNGGFDLEYAGLDDQETKELRLKSSSSRRYKLQLFDGDGNQVDVPTAYAESATNITVGEDTGVATRSDQKRLIMDETKQIEKNDYFVVTGGTASDGSAKSYLLQYKGSDKSSDTSPKIKFKNVGSGESLEYSASNVDGGNTISTIKLGGYSFPVETIGSDQTSDDYTIRVQLDSDAIANTTSGSYVDFIDYYGSQWAFNVTGSNSNFSIDSGEANCPFYFNVTGVQWVMTTPNADDYDNQGPFGLGINISATSGNELRAAILTTGAWAGTTLSGGNLLTPDGESEVSYGYNSMGAFIRFDEPSGDPDELTVTYPKQQRLPKVYFTSGATTTSSTAGGDLTRVTVVDATKLDSEIASASAQNLIVVGGPCVNTVAAELLGNPADCTEGFTPGKARVKLFEHANGNMAMLVAGYSGADTRLAGKVISHRWSELSGAEVEVEGTTYSDATIAAPMATG